MANVAVRPIPTVTVDFTVNPHGNIMLLNPLTQKAEQWIDSHLSDCMHFNDAVCIEPQFLPEVLEGISGDGLLVR
jgi:hypothetical protein